MQYLVRISIVVLALLMSGTAGAEELQGPIEIMAIRPVLGNTCVAVAVAADEGQAVSGLMLYNNDDQTVFPVVMAAAAYPGQAPNLSDALVIVDNVGGQEDAWSELQFPQPVASPTGRFYVIFQFPSFAESGGRGVGPGIGYELAPAPSEVYLTGDGDDWLKMISAQRLLVKPMYSETAAKSAGSVLMLPLPSEPLAEAEIEEVIKVTQLLRPYPNPFNPTVKFDFTLKDPSKVRLSIYDIRGRLIQEVVNEVLPMGRYKRTWQGEDRQGRRMASGVYFARMEADGQNWTHRMVLVK